MSNTTIRPAFAILLASLGLLSGQTLAAVKPNIILIYSDDHGYADLGVQGSVTDIKTPNLDALARDGVRFKRGYVSAPQCVPSRAGVITGRYQQRFGVEDNGKGPLPLAELTIAERLRPAGYVSCQVGKWHLEPLPRPSQGKKALPNVTTERAARDGNTAMSFLPHAQGFDEYFCGPMNSFVASHDLSGNRLANAPQMLTDNRFRCLWQTDAALSFIARHSRESFFLYLAYFTPHVPLESPEPWFSQTPASAPMERRQALAMIAAMDEGVGRIRQKLHAAGISKNTLIFFIGDNGAPLKEGAWDGSLNLPLVGEKGMLTDGGIRTPFLAAWPGTLPAGKVYEPPVINLDVAATAVAVAGLPHDDKLDGVNLIPYLLGEKHGNPHNALFWRWRSQAAVLGDHWKLILLGPEERYLFDLDSPEGETKNRIDAFPQVAADLDRKLMAWNATLPPPGLPRDLNDQDQLFFDAHVNKTGTVVTNRTRGRNDTKRSAAVAADPMQGWVGRNCKLATRDGVLHLEADGVKTAAYPFIARSGLDLPGPVTVTIHLRSAQGGAGSIAWRSQEDRDFSASQSVGFTLPAGTDWQDIRVVLPVTGRLIHLRIVPHRGASPEIQRIELQDKDAKLQTWRFESD